MKIVCIEPCATLSKWHIYTANEKRADTYRVFNDKGDFRRYSKTRFIEWKEGYCPRKMAVCGKYHSCSMDKIRWNDYECKVSEVVDK